MRLGRFPGWWILLTSALAAVVAPAAGAPGRTQARLVVSAAAARPGDTVMAGVLLKMPPGWHTYWRNSGDSGMPTKVDWTLPDGIRAGDLQWPVPEKLTVEGITTYIYNDQVLLMAPLTLAGSLSPGPKTLKAQVSWLECEKLCVPGKAEVIASLEVGTGGRPSPEAGLFDDWKKRLPRPASADQGVAAGWEPPIDDKTRSLVLETSQKDAQDFLPYAVKNWEIEGETERLAAAGDKVRIRKRVKRYGGEWPARLRGVVLGKAAGGASGTEIDVPIAGNAPGGPSPAPAMAASAAGAGASSPTAGAASTESRSLAVILLFAFVGGLILNVMPCVLPVIALKILGFVQQGKEAPKRVRRLGLLYALGVLVSFGVLAGMVIGVKLAGHQASWGMQYQNPHFVMAMTVLVLLVALNLFGVFEVTLGGRAMGAAGELASREGAGGAFFNGVLATLLATPCSAPFMGAALGFAFAQPPGIIVLTLLTLGLGLAAPYVVLSWRPDWLKFLPKPGAWMERFKKAMGFPMLATVVWLFRLTLGHFTKSGVFWFGVFLVAVSMSAWIWGEFVQRASRRRWAGMLASVLVTASVAALAVSRPPELEWTPWSPEAVARARAEGRPILVDFTADWCATCQVNMRTSINIKPVREKLGQLNAVTLAADFSGQDELIGKELEKFGREAVPLVLVYPRDPAKPPIVLPDGYLTPKIVLDALDKAGQ